MYRIQECEIRDREFTFDSGEGISHGGRKERGENRDQPKWHLLAGVRLHPEAVAMVNQGDTGSGIGQLRGKNTSGIPTAHDGDIVAEIGMRVALVMGNLK